MVEKKTYMGRLRISTATTAGGGVSVRGGQYSRHASLHAASELLRQKAHHISWLTIVIYSGYFPKRMFPVQPYLSYSICFQFRITKSISENVRAVRARRGVIKLTLRSRKVGWRERGQFAFHKSRFWIIRCTHRGIDPICLTYQNGGKPRLVSLSPKSSPFSITPPLLLSRLCSILDIEVIFVLSSLDLELLRFFFTTASFLPPICAVCFSMGIIMDKLQETNRTSWLKRKASLFMVLGTRLYFVSVHVISNDIAEEVCGWHAGKDNAG